jgi:integrase
MARRVHRMNSLSSTGWDGLRIRNDLNPPCHSCREGSLTSRTPSTTQRRWSERRGSVELKIIQEQVGHECDSSTAVYTHVSDDFMNTALSRALAPAFAGV